jgi:hypothetical protein
MAAQFELSNAEAERQVRFRYMLAFLVIIPIGGVGGDLIVNLPRSRSLSPSPLVLVVLLAVGLALALGLGYLSARAISMLSVPKAISIRDGAIVGDFRRDGWSGAPVKEIRLAEVRTIRKARLLRVPLVIGRKNASRWTPVYESPFFYVTEANAAKIRAALDRASGAGTGDPPQRR